MKRQGVFDLVACAFSTLGDRAEACSTNGYHASDDKNTPYCKKHRIFECLRTTLATLDSARDLDQDKIRGVPKLKDGNTNWDAAVAEKLGLKQDGGSK